MSEISKSGDRPQEEVQRFRRRFKFDDPFTRELTDRVKEKLEAALDIVQRPFPRDFEFVAEEGAVNPYSPANITSDMENARKKEVEVMKFRLGEFDDYRDYINASRALRGIQLALLSSMKSSNWLGDEVDILCTSHVDSMGDSTCSGADAFLFLGSELDSIPLGIEFVLDQGQEDAKKKVDSLTKLIRESGYRTPAKYVRTKEEIEKLSGELEIESGEIAGQAEAPKVYVIIDRKLASDFLESWARNGSLDSEQLGYQRLPVQMLVQIQKQCSYYESQASLSRRFGLAKKYKEAEEKIKAILANIDSQTDYASVSIEEDILERNPSIDYVCNLA